MPATALTRLLYPATIVAAMLGVSLPAGATAASAAARPASPGRPPVPVLHWRPCTPAGFQCATARVPLDYREPRGATISIAMIRHLATDPARRIGTPARPAMSPGIC